MTFEFSTCENVFKALEFKFNGLFVVKFTSDELPSRFVSPDLTFGSVTPFDSKDQIIYTMVE